MHIRRLEIRNFRSIRHLVVDLGETTVFVGPNNAGKTAMLIGLAEEVLPSWHGTKKGDGSAALKEERRGCFVAVTRTKRRLILSRARQYRGWPKPPSRFLEEMGCCLSGPRARSVTEAGR